MGSLNATNRHPPEKIFAEIERVGLGLKSPQKAFLAGSLAQHMWGMPVQSAGDADIIFPEERALHDFAFALTEHGYLEDSSHGTSDGLLPRQFVNPENTITFHLFEQGLKSRESLTPSAIRRAGSAKRLGKLSLAPLHPVDLLFAKISYTHPDVVPSIVPLINQLISKMPAKYPDIKSVAQALIMECKNQPKKAYLAWSIRNHLLLHKDAHRAAMQKLGYSLKEFDDAIEFLKQGLTGIK